MNFLSELWKRNVIRSVVAYGVAAWLVLQVCDLVMDWLGWPDAILYLVWAGLGAGFGVVAVLSWHCALTLHGLECDPEDAPDPSDEDLTARRLDLIIVSLVIIALGLLVFDYSVDQDLEPGVDAHIRPELQERLEAELEEDAAREQQARD